MLAKIASLAFAPKKQPKFCLLIESTGGDSIECFEKDTLVELYIGSESNDAITGQEAAALKLGRLLAASRSRFQYAEIWICSSHVDPAQEICYLSGLSPTDVQNEDTKRRDIWNTEQTCLYDAKRTAINDKFLYTLSRDGLSRRRVFEAED
ncbi:hypothetical protein FGG08_006936 [Glutinoglossum americanum]|uniref:Uncharacterized protein n=1 Tax=Glutinoglossum americanum TaxID=1670608 RepID=A0A9P8HV07_9PEZI|nr:hypothetical protein FGG08_006936 [Glutinoglossum americanum]